MNKVTSYLKNVSKSVAYASADIGLKLIPDVKDFVDTNEELFKSIYATVSHGKKSITYGKKMAKDSQLYKDIDKGIKNALEDIKSGNIYNKARSDAAIDAAGSSLAFGDDDFGDFNFDDFDDNFDDNFDDFDDESDKSSSSSISKGDIVVAETVSTSTNLSAQLISKTVANTSKAIIDTNIATTNMVMAQNVELMAGLRTSIMGMHQSINKALEFAVNVTKPQYDIQSEYFSKTQDLMTENNAILKEMLEMQRNMYKKQETSKPNDQFNNVFSGGSIDLKEYFKAIGKNIKGFDKTGSFDMLTSSMGEQSMLSQILSNPLGFVMTGLVSSMMPSSLAKSISHFNKTLSGIFPAMVAKLNRWKDRDDGSIFSYLGQIFGLSYDTKKTIDTSKYNKGAVPFDGITRKAIVDIIPEHLSKIESLLTGQSQRVYDFQNGKWTDAISIKKKLDDEYASDLKGTFSEIDTIFKHILDKMESQSAIDYDTRKTTEEDILRIYKKVYEEDHHISPANIKKNLWEYNVENKEIIEKMLDILPELKGITGVLSNANRNIYETHKRRGDRLRSEEEHGDSLRRKMYDDSKLNSHLIFDDKYNISKGVDLNTIIGIAAQAVKSNSDLSLGDYKGIITKELRDRIDKEEKNKTAYNKRYNTSDIDKDEALSNAGFSARQKFKDLDLDLDDLPHIGKLADREIKSHKVASEIEGETFFQKFSNATSWKAKKAVLYSSLDNIAKKPVEMINGLIYKADKSIYNLLFGEEYDPDMDDEKKSKDLKGLMGDIHNQLVSYMTLFTEKLDEKIVGPMVKKFGLDEKWNKFKEKFNDIGLVQRLKQFGLDVKGSLKSNASSIGNYTKDSVREVLSPIIDDPFVADARMNVLEKTKNRKQKKYIKNLQELYSRNYNPQNQTDYTNISKDQTKKAYQRYLKLNKDKHLAGGKTEIPKTGVYVLRKGETIIPPEAIPRNEYGIDPNVLYNEFKKEISLGYNLSGGSRLEKLEPEAKKSRAIAEKYNKKISDVSSNRRDSGWVTPVIEELKNAGDTIKNKAINILGIEGDTPEEQEKSIEKEKNKLIETVGSIMGEMKGTGADTVAKSIIGGGIGLFSGIIGGPLIGAAVGAGYSILKNSETVQNFLFGDVEKDEDGFITKQEGGKINKDIYNTFKKYLPDMGKYGVTGAVASLLLPFGPFAGAAIGAGIGLAKNSSTMSEMLFGDEEGLFNAKRKEKIKKLLPKAAAGAAAGMVLGPFGLFGNAVLGSGVGLLTGTEEFKNLILGEPDQDGDRIGGLKGALEEHFINPIKDFGLKFKDNFFEMLKVNMIDPLNEAISPIASEIAFQTKRLAFGLPKMLYNLIGDNMVKPLGKRLFDYAKPFIGALGAPIIGAAKLGQKAIFAPFKGARQLSRGLRTHQVKQNRADYMTAQERLDWMESRGYKSYNTKAQDEIISKMDDKSVSDAAYLLEGATGGLEYFDNKIRRNNKKLSKQIYGGYKGKYANKLKNLINKGKLSEATELLNTAKLSGDMSPEQFDTYRKEIIKLMTKNDELKKQKKGLNSYLSDDGTTVDPDKVIEKLNGIGLQVNDKEDLKALLKNMRTEARSRKKFDPNKIAESDLTPEGKAVTSLLKDILDTIKGAKDSAEANDGKMVGATTKDINKHNTLLDNIGEIEEEQKEIRDKKITNKINTLTALGLDPSTFEGDNKKEVIKIISDDKKYKIVLKALKKGVKVKPEHILNLGKYSNKQLRGLSRRPSLIVMNPKMVNRYLSWNFLDTMGLSTIQNRNVLEKASKEGLDLSDDDAVADLMGNHRTTTFMERSIMGARKVKEQVKYHFTDKGAQRYIIDEKGNVNLDNADAGTKEATKALEEESKHRFSLANTLNSMKDGVLGLFNRQKDKDEKEEKEPFLKRLFNFDLGDSKLASGLKFGGLLAAGLTAVGGIKNMWDNREPGGLVDRVGTSIGNFVKSTGTKVIDWFSGSGEYEGEGLPRFLEEHVYPNLFTGFNVIFQKVLPALIKSFIVSLPTLIKAGVKGIGSLITDFLGIGRDKSHDNDNKIDSNSIKIGGNSVQGVKASNWIDKVSQDAKTVANEMVGYSTALNNGTSYESYQVIGLEDNNTYTNQEQRALLASKQNNTSNNKANDVLTNAKKTTPSTNGEPKQELTEEQKASLSEPMTFGEGLQMYKKDSEGKLIPMTGQDYYDSQGQILEFYTETGAKYVYDQVSGQYIPEGGGEPVAIDDDSLMKRFGNVFGRSLLTGKSMGIMRLGNSKLANSFIGKGIKGIGKGADWALSRTPFIKTPYKIGKFGFKGVGKGAEIASNLGVRGNAYGSYAINALKEGYKPTEIIKDIGSDITGNVKNSKPVKAVKNSKAGNAAKKIKDKALNSNTGKKIAEVGNAAKDSIKIVIDWVKSGIDKILNNNYIFNKIKEGLKKSGKESSEKAVKKTIKEMIEKMMSKFTSTVVEKLSGKLLGKLVTKITAAVASAGLITLGFSIVDFTVGFDQAESILGIEEVSFVQRLLAGLVNIITNELFFGLIDSKTIVDWCVDIIFPFFNLNLEEFKKQRAIAEENTRKYNQKHADEAPISTEERLKQDKLTYKASQAWEGAKSWAGEKLNDAGNFIADNLDPFGWFESDKEKEEKKKDKKKSKENAKKLAGSITGMVGSMKDTVTSVVTNATNANTTTTASEDIANAGNVTSMEQQATLYQTMQNNMTSAFGIMDMQLGKLYGFTDASGNPISLTEGVNSFNESDLKKNVKGQYTFADLMKLQNEMFAQTATALSSNNLSTSSIAKTTASVANGLMSGISRFFGGRGTNDEGFISQLDPKYRNKKIGNEDVATAGCAPATAANILNYYSGRGTMDNATKAASMYQSADGGVTPEYFENYLGSQGIGTYSTMNKKEMINGIASGRPTVLLGSDPTNKANTPYGSSSSHYILATGLDGRGNVIVQDPESRKPNALYPMKDLINQSHLGMITGKGTRGIKGLKGKLNSVLNRIGFGRGSNTMHEDLGVWSELTASEINDIIKRQTGGKTRGFTGKGEYFVKAAKASGLNPRYILAHAAIESAWGDSNYAKAGNFFGIGAFDSNPDNAYKYGNSDMESGLINGAKWIRKNYYDQGQNTVYKMRFNNGVHEYATDPNWADNIANLMDSMPANGNAIQHQPDDSITAGSDSTNTSGGLFARIEEAAKSYFDPRLLQLISGSDSSTGGLSGNPTPNTETVRTAKEFYEKYKGVAVDYDGQYDAQCVDLFAQYMNDVVGSPHYKTPSGGAESIADDPKLDKYFDKFTDPNKAQYGDWVVWGPYSEGSNSKYGHVGMVTDYNPSNNTIATFGVQQEYAHSPASVNDIRAGGVKAFLRYRGSGKGTNKQNHVAKYLSSRSNPVYYNNTIPVIEGINSINPGDSIPPTSLYDDYNNKTRIRQYNSMPSLSGKGTYTLFGSTNSYQTENTSNDSKVERLISVVIEVLKIIADNTSKLSEIVTLLSKSLDINLTDQEISKLSSNNAQIKNKIANALKSQGSPNGIGSSVMNANTQSLADALYSIARA